MRRLLSPHNRCFRLVSGRENDDDRRLLLGAERQCHDDVIGGLDNEPLLERGLGDGDGDWHAIVVVRD